MEPAIFFTGAPNLEELWGVTVKVHTVAGLNVMNPQVVKCREIIFTEPYVISSPVFDTDACFNIVLPKSIFETGILQSRLQKQKMQMSKPYSVQPSLYQSCLTYTLIVKLCPLWNKAGNWMVQGRDFLSHEGCANAIKMSVNVNREEIYISLIGTVIRSPPLQVEDMDLSRYEKEAIFKHSEDLCSLVELSNAWCHVLPSMKRGKISSISLTLPKDSPFPSYKELKKHWKNMYGYRLPETNDNVLYCQIQFMTSGKVRFYTYPNVCLRSCPMQEVPRVDPKPVWTAFLQDLHAKLGSVCGKALRFQPKLRYAAPILHSSAQPPVRVNLSTRPVNKSSAPIRDNHRMAKLFESSDAQRELLRERLLGSEWADSFMKETAIVNASTERAERALSTQQLDTQASQKNFPLHTQTPKETFNSDQASDQRQMSYGSGRMMDGPLQETKYVQRQTLMNEEQSERRKYTASSEQIIKKFVPVFRPKVKRANMEQQVCRKNQDGCSGTGSQAVAVFKSINQQKQTFSSTRRTQDRVSYTNPHLNCSKTSDESFALASIHKPQKNFSVEADDSLHKLQSASPAVEKFVPIFRPKMKRANMGQHAHIKRQVGHSCNSSLPIFKSVKPQISLSTSAGKTESYTSCTSPYGNDIRCKPTDGRACMIQNDTSSCDVYEPPKLFSLNGDTDSDQVYNLHEYQTPLPPSALLLSKDQSILKGSQIVRPKTQTHQSGAKKAKHIDHIAQKGNEASTPVSEPKDNLLKPPHHSPRPGFVRSGNMIDNHKPIGSLGMQSKAATVCIFSSFYQSMGEGDDDDDFDYVVGMPKLPSSDKHKKASKVDAPLKKPRSKPQVQNIDVESLAAVNQLNKVNTVTLIGWLRDRGVACRSKDKKGDLISKINTFLNNVDAEQ